MMTIKDVSQPGFLTPLRVELVQSSWHKSYWILTAPLIYVTHVTPSPELVYVPAEFETDFASVPRIPLAYLFCGSVGHGPAVVHDYLYFRGIYARKTCDQIFLEALKARNLMEPLPHIMYGAVRSFGWRYYNEISKKEHEQ